MESGQPLVVRYERLHSYPINGLRSVTDKFQPVPDERIAAALETCAWGSQQHDHVRLVPDTRHYCSPNGTKQNGDKTRSGRTCERIASGSC
jgi:hypothetical protein